MSADVERLDNGIVELYSLNVGQANAAVIITEMGQIVLNDADEDEITDELESVLADRTIDRTDNGTVPLVFAATHLHRDHVDGLTALNPNEYEISHAIQPDDARIEIYEPDSVESETGITKEKIQDYVKDLGTLGVEEITQVSCGDRVPIDSNADLSVLAPPATDNSVDVTRASTGAAVNLPPKRPNENGAVYKLEGERSALFMGDVQDKSDHYAESWLIQQHDDPESDVDLGSDILFVAHHGSAHATSEEFLDRVDPEIAVVSSDLDGQYDHPHDEVLKYLHEHDVAVYWTAGHGMTRTDLDEQISTEQTTDLDTTNAADLAALKQYCRANDIDPASVESLAPGDLPEETPDWVVESAPMVAETPEKIVDAAIANAESAEELRHTLAATPEAHDYLRETIQADRDEHVPTRVDVRRNRKLRASIKQAEIAYRNLPLHTRVRANLPNRFGGIDHPLEDVPSIEEIDGPRTVEELPLAVKKPPAGKLRKRGKVLTANKLDSVEEATDAAVAAAATSEELWQSLRNTPGTHKDLRYALDILDAHDSEPERITSRERENQPERIRERAQTTDQDVSLGL